MSKDEILLINDRGEEHSLISGILAEMNFALRRADSITAIAFEAKQRPAAVILDMDDASVTNRALREIAAGFPGLPVLGISSRRFHPDLAESIRDCIYACLNRPLDPDELRYWLKSILRDGPSLEDDTP